MNFLLKYVTVWLPILTLIFGIAGYYIRTNKDVQIKKIEVKFSLFHNQRLIAITAFLGAYTPLETFFWQIAYRDVVTRVLSPKDLDLKYLPLYNQFLSSYYALHLVLSEHELQGFNLIHSEIQKVSHELGELFYLNTDEKNEINRAVNQYVRRFSKLINDNKQRINQIGTDFQKIYQV